MNSIAFIAAMIKGQGAGNNFDPQGARHLKLYVEMETRKLIEIAIKYMLHDKRTILTARDVEIAAEHLKHQDLLPLVYLVPKRDQNNKEIQISQLPDLCETYFGNRIIEYSQVKGYYLLKDGKMNPEPHNVVIRRLRHQQITSNCQKRGQLGNFNLIREQTECVLTEEQRHYLCSYEMRLQKNKPKLIWQYQGNINKVFPLCVGLATKYINQASIKLIYILVTHANLQSQILMYYLDKILEVLLAYQGAWSYQVGTIIAFLVNRFKQYQTELLMVMQIASPSYSAYIKAIAFEEVFGNSCVRYISDQIIKQAIEDSQNGNKMASLYIKTLLDREQIISGILDEQISLPFWIPQPFLQTDLFLHNL